ncbi:MAG: hypothetical protein HN472_12040 [Nitrospina sp.]|nr:hypothetical protein [Nitrospina sp.]MBT3923199.1 hypothetical protein [Nitrospina sp.]MBT5633288.1 hypothetical protein [Nitrospina sp.]MBT6901466.1 hypothetical protein [Nitrospina sp.]MBT7197356.1 hypothetical protein [Nitrospina sp.]
MKKNRSIWPKYVARKCLADYYPGLSGKTLANLALEGRGPRHFKRGRNVYYRTEELDKFIEEGDSK